MIGGGYSPTRVWPVDVRENTAAPIELYMCSDVATTTLSGPVALDEYVFPVTSATGISPFQCFTISQDGHMMQALVQTVNGNNITLSVPSDKAFTAGAVVNVGNYNMNVSASAGAPQYFSAGPPVGVTWDVLGITIGILDGDAMGDGLFGGMVALTNGVVLRKRNGFWHNILVVNNNKGFKDRGFDFAYSDKPPAGSNGCGGTKRFGGQHENGVSIRLFGDDGDKLEWIIRDNLSGLTEFSSTIHGHVMENLI